MCSSVSLSTECLHLKFTQCSSVASNSSWVWVSSVFSMDPLPFKILLVLQIAVDMRSSFWSCLAINNCKGLHPSLLHHLLAGDFLDCLAPTLNLPNLLHSVAGDFRGRLSPVPKCRPLLWSSWCLVINLTVDLLLTLLHHLLAGDFLGCLAPTLNLPNLLHSVAGDFRGRLSPVPKCRPLLWSSWCLVIDLTVDHHPSLLHHLLAGGFQGCLAPQPRYPTPLWVPVALSVVVSLNKVNYSSFWIPTLVINPV